MIDPCPVGYPLEEWRAHSTVTRTIYRLRLEVADARAEIRRLEARVVALEQQLNTRAESPDPGKEGVPDGA